MKMEIKRTERIDIKSETFQVTLHHSGNVCLYRYCENITMLTSEIDELISVLLKLQIEMDECEERL